MEMPGGWALGTSCLPEPQITGSCLPVWKAQQTGKPRAAYDLLQSAMKGSSGSRGRREGFSGSWCSNEGLRGEGEDADEERPQERCRRQTVPDSSGEQRRPDRGETRSQYEKFRLYKAYLITR